MPGLIDREWRLFSEKVLDSPAITVEERMMARRYFYSGAGIVLNAVMTQFYKGESEEPTEEDIEMIDNLGKELDEFQRALSEGRA